MRAALVAVIGVAACRAPPPVVAHRAPPAPGLAIAIYEDGDRTVAIVDDRRTIEIRGGEVVLEQLAGASLASLVVEAAGEGARGLGVGACRREAAGAVRCAARGAPGRVFARIVYASSTLAFRSRHAIAASDDRATIETTFELALPVWGRRATIALYDGVPGGPRPPVLLGTFAHALDGAPASLQLPARTVAARRIVVFDPLRRVGDDEPVRDGGALAWEWLELATPALPPGELEVYVGADGPTSIEAPTTAAVTVGDALRIPLRAELAVHGRRERRGELEQGGVQVDRLRFSLTNDDVRAHAVIIEEQLRAGTTRRIREASPHRPTIAGDVARLELEVPATGTARAELTIAYPP